MAIAVTEEQTTLLTEFKNLSPEEQAERAKHAVTKGMGAKSTAALHSNGIAAGGIFTGFFIDLRKILGSTPLQYTFFLMSVFLNLIDGGIKLYHYIMTRNKDLPTLVQAIYGVVSAIAISIAVGIGLGTTIFVAPYVFFALSCLETLRSFVFFVKDAVHFVRSKNEDEKSKLATSMWHHFRAIISHSLTGVAVGTALAFGAAPAVASGCLIAAGVVTGLNTIYSTYLSRHSLKRGFTQLYRDTVKLGKKVWNWLSTKVTNGFYRVKNWAVGYEEIPSGNIQEEDNNSSPAAQNNPLQTPAVVAPAVTSLQSIDKQIEKIALIEKFRSAIDGPEQNLDANQKMILIAILKKLDPSYTPLSKPQEEPSTHQAAIESTPLLQPDSDIAIEQSNIELIATKSSSIAELVYKVDLVQPKIAENVFGSFQTQNLVLKAIETEAPAA